MCLTIETAYLQLNNHSSISEFDLGFFIFASVQIVFIFIFLIIHLLKTGLIWDLFSQSHHNLIHNTQPIAHYAKLKNQLKLKIKIRICHS